jgi:hypothetical protein
MKKQFGGSHPRVKGASLARRDNKPETFGDDEFNRAMEEALREDRELLEKLAEI